MKVVMSVLVALSVVAGLSASADATFKPSPETQKIFDKIAAGGIN